MSAVRRIIADIIDLEADALPGVFIHVNEDNVFDIHVVIVGPEDTPYEGGFHFFHMKFNHKYPYQPPVVQYLTTNGRVRMNPNLYENGKVCLSILGTWEGPGWTSVMNLRSLLLSLQSILSECPLHNEPSFANEPSNSLLCRNYSNVVTYYNRFLAIHSVLENPPVPHFGSTVQQHITANKPLYAKIIEKARSEVSAIPAFVVASYGIRVTSEDKARLVKFLEASLGGLIEHDLKTN